MPKDSFSKRQGFAKSNPPISIWEDAPQDMRYAVLKVAEDDCELSPSQLRDLVCKALRKQPNENNWSEYPNIWDEVQSLFARCDWFYVYDIIELISMELARDHNTIRVHGVRARTFFETETNCILAEFGVGWKLENGVVVARGEESYEEYLREAEKALIEAKRPTALNELREAIRDVSRRPVPDTSGAIQHAMAALECVSRDATDDPKSTLGELIKLNPELFPRPLDQAVAKLWGFASENARHGKEGNDPSREESMLIVGISATLANYLIHKMGLSDA